MSFAVFCSNTGYAIETDFIKNLKSDLQNRKSTSFASLTQHWEQRYGTRAFTPLLEIAADSNNEDADRYVALMSAAKLGGSDSALLLTSFLKDPSWMLRSGALRALSALENPKTAEAALPLLNDSALAVRAEAVDAIKILKPKGSIEALTTALEDSKNYHAGIAQWVPQRALQALVLLQAKNSIPTIISLLASPDHQQDVELIAQGIRALEALTGKKAKAQASLSEKLRTFKTGLISH